MSKPVTIRILGDASSLERALADSDRALGRFQTGLAGKVAKVGAAIGGIFAAQKVAQFGADSIAAASSLQESLGKVGVVFGNATEDVVAWSETSARAFGLSQQKALEAAGTYGNLFQAFGIGQKPAQEMSTSLVQLAADLASFNNTSVEDALAALQSGLSGETEPLKRYGVALSDVRLKEEALALGLIKSTKEALTPAAKAQAAYSLAMKDTRLAQGDFQRTSGGLANQQRILKAEFENLQAKVGQALLPALTALVKFAVDKVIPAFDRFREVVGKAAGWVQDNFPRLLPILAGLGAVVLAVLVPAFIGWATSAGAAAVATLAALAPVIAVAAAIGLLVAGVVYAWQNFEVFRTIVLAVWEGIKTYITVAITVIRTYITTWVTVVLALWNTFGGAIMQAVRTVWDTIRGVIDGALRVVRGIIQTVTSLIRGDWSGAWEGIKNIVGGAKDYLLAVAGGILGWFRSVWTGITSAISAPFRAGMDVIRSVVGGLQSFFAGIINGIRSAWNNTIGGKGFSTPDWIPGIGGKDFTIPKLADGGIVTKPTLALIGEAGPEAVLPLRQAPRLMGDPFLDGGSSAGGGVVVNVRTNADPFAIGREVAWAMRTSGR